MNWIQKSAAMGFVVCLKTSLLFAQTVVINGVSDPQILKLVRSQAVSPWSQSRFSGDATTDRCRLDNDIEAIKLVLHSFGYFDATVSADFNHDQETFEIDLKERYKIDNITIVYEDDENYSLGLRMNQLFDLVDIKMNSYIDTQRLAEVGEKIDQYLGQQGFAFAHMYQPELKIDKSKKKISVTYRVKLNGRTIIGKTIVKIKSKKDPRLLEPFVRNRITWHDNEIYDAEKIEEAKTCLMDTGIFALIDVTMTDHTIDPKTPKISHANIVLTAEEAPLRDVSVGVKYGTSEKLGLLASWTHYNIDGKGSRFGTLFELSKHTKSGRVKYSNFDTFGKAQELASQVFYLKENVATYDVSKAGMESILWQNFGVHFKVGTGICGERSKTLDKVDLDETDIQDPTAEKVKFNAVGVPLGINFDSTDTFLDPQRGIRGSGTITPYFGNLKNLTILSGKVAAYFPFKQNTFKNSMVIAVYSKVGSILRDANNVIPRDKLFFAGGANSVRGYGNQKLGPINKNKKPLGGESVFEIGAETRYRLNEKIGLVLFFEGGNVYSSKIPNPFHDMMFGYGFGMRYYTPLGPVRIDLAFPTKRRKLDDGKPVDSRFNIYISVGQAF
ncbi:MAG: BamA/TamA family outer membrane protein [Holosporales bacterium]|jgi:translocation and assembly module TamA|nr:BamA/TamA family outer membrane protein [Holosporales bacterium]